ncbi:MAG TPA: helix-turn-helix transcriptional regulator [Dehalococcoidia bacterium]|nr:helix-turn-helix transcriptional regulator [Dehalococcoidia bacterium]
MHQQDLDFYALKAEVCKTLADPRRLYILNELRAGEMSVGELASVCELNQAVVSRHLAILRNGGVVTARREGTSVYYKLADQRIGEACDVMQQVVLAKIEKNRQLAERLAISEGTDA